MSGFLYFAESNSEKPADVDTLRKAGIYYAFADNGFLGMPRTSFTRKGPGDKPGYLFGDERQLGTYQVQYRPDDQRWRKIPGTTSRVGIYTEAPPTPDTLARGQILSGYHITLEDGNRWEVPCARLFVAEELNAIGNSSVILPRYLDMDDQGKWVSGDVVDRYRKLAGIADKFWQMWYPALIEAVEKTDDVIPVEYELTVEDAMFVLGQNYRISGAECALLRLFATTGEAIAMGVLERLCDCPSAVDFMLAKQKKNQLLDTTDTNVGNAA